MCGYSVWACIIYLSIVVLELSNIQLQHNHILYMNAFFPTIHKVSPVDLFLLDWSSLKVSKTVDLIKAKGGKVTREPGPVKGGKTVIAFIEDPDGYKFELLERGPTPEPLCQVMLRVGDLDHSINFYQKVRIILNGKCCLTILFIKGKLIAILYFFKI